jgi:Spy/CpxP family protein refolding chaperone
MNILVPVALVPLALVLAMAPAGAAQRHCDLAQDFLLDAIQDECETHHSPDNGQAQANPRPPHKWWLSDEGRAEFSITDAQSRDLEAIFQQVLPTLKTNKSDLDRQEKALAQLLNDANSPETMVVQTIDRVEAARSALSRTRTLMLYRMYRLLSAEQRVKVQAYQERKAQEGGGLSTRR